MFPQESKGIKCLEPFIKSMFSSEIAMVDHQILQSESSNPQSAFKAPRDRCPPRPYHETLALKELLYDTKLKLEEFSVSRTSPSISSIKHTTLTKAHLQANTSGAMDPNGSHHGGNRSSQSGHYGYDPKGHGGDPGVFDGLLPRIETRGQSRSGRSKYDDKSKRGSKR